MSEREAHRAAKEANFSSRPGPLSAKDLDLLIELYEKNKQAAIARALEGVSLGSIRS